MNTELKVKVTSDSSGKSKFLVAVLLAFVLGGNASVAVAAEPDPGSITVDCVSDPSALTVALSALSSPTNDGAVLAISGTCKGNFIIPASITLKKALGAPTAILDGDSDGDGVGNGTVVRISGGKTVILEGLTIQHGGNAFAGGISNEGSNLTILNSTVGGNTGNVVGGIYNYSSANLTMENSTVSGNAGLSAGGIENFASNLTTENSTVSGNTGATGGIYNVSSSGVFSSLVMEDSTVSGNMGSSAAGGIYNPNYSSLAMRNSTVSGNSATGAGGILDSSSDLSIEDSIIAGNNNSNNHTYDNIRVLSAPQPQLQGFNITSGDPMLGLLDNNGGPTKTMKPLPGSPAIMPVGAACSAATDQRGAPRPGVGKASCDVGAYETGDARLEVSPPLPGDNHFFVGTADSGGFKENTLVVKNTGNGVFLAADNNPSFESPTPFSFSPPPTVTDMKFGDTVDYPIRYTPTVNGDETGKFIIKDAGNTEVLMVLLKGTGQGFSLPPIQQIQSILDFINANVPAGLQGIGPGKSAANRLKAFTNMIKTAGDLINAGDYASACIQLSDAEKKVDGQANPPDFVGGSKASELHTMIAQLMGINGLSCSNYQN